jgi:dipeptidyl aminopeptidase/acylaminoacyl peptidase
MDAAVPAEPTMLTSAGVALAPHGLRDSRVVFSRNSTLAPTDVFVLDPAARAERRLTAFADAALRGVALPAVSEMWFEGAEGRTVHSWVVLPPGFEQGEEKKWPVSMRAATIASRG